MSPLSRTSTFSPANMIPWLLTGVFMFAHVQAVETSVGRTLCPIRLLRQLRYLLQSRRRRPARRSRYPSTHPRKGELP